MNNQIIPVNQDVINLRNLLTVYRTPSIHSLLCAFLDLGLDYDLFLKVDSKINPVLFSNLDLEFASCGLFDSQTELGRRQINAVLEVINELEPENLFDKTFGFD